MKNTVGQVPRGDNFFPREELINKIYKRLEADTHLYLAAPRRMGKTAIMRHLEDQPRAGYEFHYFIVESIHDPVDYLDGLIKTLQSFKTWNERTFEIFKEWLPKLRFSLSENEVGIVWEQHRNRFEQFKAFISALKPQKNKVVVMIDEFPQAIANLAKQNPDMAKRFLQFNREIRQLAPPCLRFILTGSLSLHGITEKLGATQTINDLNLVEIPLFSESQALTFVKQLLDEVPVRYQPEMCETVLQRIGSFHPFYLQLAVQELIDEFESTSHPIDSSAIDRALNKILHRRNNHYFEHYYERLKSVFSEKELSCALLPLFYRNGGN